MTYPKHCSRRVAAKKKLNPPKNPARAGFRAAGTHQTVALERHMAGFVSQNQFAHRREWAIGRIFPQHSIITCADQFGKREHLQFKFYAKHSSAQAECCETPM